MSDFEDYPGQEYFWKHNQRIRETEQRARLREAVETGVDPGMTYTYVEMPVSQKTYEEIKENLLTAGYEHAIHGQALDMHGIALIPLPSDKGAMKCAPGGNKILSRCSCGSGLFAAFIIKGKAMCFVCKENYEKEKAAKAKAKGR